jgi:Domian of unknown function (DUF4952)
MLTLGRLLECGRGTRVVLFGAASIFAVSWSCRTPPQTTQASGLVAHPRKEAHPSVEKKRPSRDCGDLLASLVRLPSHVRFLSCNKGVGQVLFTARYEVDGKYAGEVASLLSKKVGMGPLRFRCCGWEPASAGQATVGRHSGTVTMHSVETLVKKRSDWHKIGKFYITVEIVDL